MNSSSGTPQTTNRRAFTLAELVVVLSLIGLLGLILLPALAGVRPSSKGVHCLNNLRRLSGAWLMYATDNSDQLASNPTMSPGTAWTAGILTTSLSSDNTNTLKLLDPNQTLIARYLQSADSFKCPADQTIVFGFPRVRSIALMSPLGGNSGSQANQIAGRTYFDARRITELNKPGPANTLAILDEHPASLNDANFYFRSGFNTSGAIWTDLPASFHDGGAGVSFADGHAMIRRWQSSSTLSYGGGPLNVPGSLDYTWINDRSPYR